MADKFFSTTKKGEIYELKEELRSLDRPKRKEGVKKVIAAMTVGKDVSMLFPDVVNCMQTDDMELKKLVYLYLINYAKSQPDLTIMAVNTFVKDSQDPNPLIRALAVRTMGCIRVDKITEYLCDPLQRCLKDDDPYVKKTAAICVAKLYDISPELVEDRGFIDMLQDMLVDANPMVVANAVAALQEIQDCSGKPVLAINSNTLFKLLAALNECTEWGQVFILDALGGYDCRDPKDAEKITERVLPRLQHVNSAVVLSAVKVIMKQLDVIQPLAGTDKLVETWCKKMAPPLVTLLSAEPEVQYVALRNINLVVQKRPRILANEVKVFFCKYNDPLYVKMEKLEIMIKLANEANIDQVLLELKEYAQEVDVEFVRKAVRAIGRCAVALDSAAERCVHVLLDLIHSKVNYVVQEAVVVIKDIFRKYPGRYEAVIGTLCENLESLDEPEAKASMVWIIGQYAERIENAEDLLASFLESFPEETAPVQLQLLTATVKLFLKRPSEAAQKAISLVLSCATNETDDPDLRDRAYVYWRLLSTDPEAAKQIVLADKPVIADDSHNLEPLQLNMLLGQMATLASVYFRAPETFVSRTRLAVTRADELEQHRFDESDSGGAGPGPAPTSSATGDLLGGDLAAGASASAHTSAAAGLDDLLGGMSVGGTPRSGAAPADDPFAALSAAAAPAAAAPALPVLLTAERGKGLTVQGRLTRQSGSLFYALMLSNGTSVPMDGFMIQLNSNSWGLAPSAQALAVGQLQPGASASAMVPMAHSVAAKTAAGPLSARLQVALKVNPLGVVYFEDAAPLSALLQESGTMDGNAFLSTWRALPPEAALSLPGLALADVAAAEAKLRAARLFPLARRPVPGSSQEAIYIAGRVDVFNVPILLELRLTRGVAGVDASCKCERADLVPMVFEAVQQILSS